MSASTGGLRAVLSDQRGSMLPFAVAAVFVLAALIGGGVDMSRAYKSKNRLQSACDAGVLAGRKAVGTSGFDDAAQTEAETYFAANFDDRDQQTHDTTFDATSTDDGNTVNGTATAQLDTAIMKIFRVRTISLSVDCTASMGMGNADVTMVLDTTGSMAWKVGSTSTPNRGRGETSRLEDLQVAMKNFYDTVSESTDGGNARVRYSFVPYSTTVNVGSLIIDKNPNFVVDSHEYQTIQWIAWDDPEVSTTTATTNTTYSSSWTRTGSGYSSQSSCLAVLPADTAWANDGSPTSGSTTTEYNENGQKVDSTVTSSQKQKAKNYACIYRSSDRKYYVNYRDKFRYVQNIEVETSDPVPITSTSDPWDGILYRKVSMDVSDYKNFEEVTTLTGVRESSTRVGSGRSAKTYYHYSPANFSSTWGGCIEERETVATDSVTFSGGSISPSGALDLDIDSAPDTGNDATKWAPLWSGLGYFRDDPSVAVAFAIPPRSASEYETNRFDTNEANAYCPFGAQLLEEMDEDAFYDYADSLTPGGSTYHDIGLIWGARLSSPQGIWSDIVNDEPENGSTVSRHLIFMTDGELAPSYTVHSSYGIEQNDHRITDDGQSEQSERHRLRFLAICEAIKAKGIRLWVIAFSTGVITDLETCASDSSSFIANSSGELDEAFQNIAKQVGELRVTT